MHLHHHFRSLFLLCASCSLLLFLSCQSGPEEPEGQSTVTFTVTNYKQISFDDLSGSGASRAMSSYDLATLAHLLIAVYDAESGAQVLAPVQHNHADYEESPYDYPQFSVTLPYGHYRVLVLGFNGSRACNIASLNRISWADDYVPNTFLSCEEFTLNENANLNREVTLRHVVAAFSVTAEDAIPEGMKKMRFASTAGGTVLDATTGFTPQSTGRTSDIAVPADSIGKRDVCFTAYLFLPEEQTTTSYTVQALDKNNGVLGEKRFSDVPLRINYLTSWQGKFFEKGSDDTPSTQNGLNIQWDISWADTLYIDG